MEQVLHEDRGCKILALSGSQGAQTLLHTVTGERVELPKGPTWKLGFSGGWGYIHAPGAQPQWCKDILKLSLWHSGGRHCVGQQVKGVDGTLAWQTMWLDEAAQDTSAIYVHWDASGPLSKFRCKVNVLKVARSSASLFWELPDVQLSADFDSSSATGPLSHKWIMKNADVWAKGFESIGLPADHLVKSRKAGGSEARTLHTWSVSSHGLVYLLLRWSTTMKLARDRAKAESILRPLQAASMLG
jgi:hypothetical protein